MGGSPAQQIANAHTSFNVAAAILFLIFLIPFKNLVENIVKGKEEKILLKPKYLKEKLPTSNESSFNVIEKEISYSLKITLKTFDSALDYIKHPSDDLWNKIVKLAVLNDLLDKKIEYAWYGVPFL